VARELEKNAGHAGDERQGGKPAVFALGGAEQAAEVVRKGRARMSAQVAATARQGVKWLPFPTARNIAIGKTIPLAAPSRCCIGLVMVFSFGRGSSTGG
jgi:hypothetical protein